MDGVGDNRGKKPFESVCSFLRKTAFCVISVGPIPNHVAFIMDGNRRYAKKKNLPEGAGHRAGFLALMSMLKFCYEFGIKCVTVYAFSIENFKRSPNEVRSLMELLQEKIEGLMEEESIVNRFGIRVYFMGNLKLLSDSVRSAAERAMSATACNSQAVLSICIAYTSTDEILHAIEDSCSNKWDQIRLLNFSEAGPGLIGQGMKENVQLVDIEKNMYMARVPDPDILIRTSGENRLSNFLMWQSGCCLLYSPSVLWPEIRFWHLVWAVLNFQRNYQYLHKKKKQV